MSPMQPLASASRSCCSAPFSRARSIPRRISNMRKLAPALLMLPALAGCAALGGRSATPDEFAVARNAPLIVPPDYSLAPPVAGTVAVSPAEAQAQAIEALFGGPAPRSAG